MDAKGSEMPLRAVLGGLDLSGEKIYVGRTKWEDGALLTGKVVPSHQTCYVALDGTEHGSDKYQVSSDHHLVSNFMKLCNCSCHFLKGFGKEQVL